MTVKKRDKSTLAVTALILLYKPNAGYHRFEVFTAVTMQNSVFWNIKTQFVPHRRHITSPLQSLAD
jgi:hypothetical protein